MTRCSSLTTLIALTAIFSAITCCGTCFADATADLKSANGLYQAGDFDGAIKLLQPTPKDTALGPEALKLIAYCYRSKNNTSQALVFFQKLATAFPKSSVITPDVADNIAVFATPKNADEPKDPVAEFRSMATKYPNDAVMWLYLASDALRNKDMEAESLLELLKAWDQPASKANRVWESKVNIRMYEAGFANFDKVIADSKTVLDGSTDERLLWECVIGYAYLCKGSYQDAIHELDFACQLFESDKKYIKQGRIWRTAKFCLASAHEKTKAYDKALPLYKEVAAQYPSYWRAQYGVFVCMAKQDQLSQASAYVNKVCAEQPGIKDRLRQMTTSYMLSEVE